jgi:glycosyltransferase involved in cell wall biosynthesis
MKSYNRLVWFGPWFGHHNNVRHADLLSRLNNIDVYRIRFSRYRWLRGPTWRAYNLCLPLIYRTVLACLSRRYQLLFTGDCRQIPYFPGGVIVDHDDPKFTPEETQLLNAARVRAIVVTTEPIRQKLRHAGVRNPLVVIPQGICLGDLDKTAALSIRHRYRLPDDIVVGYAAPALFRTTDEVPSNQRTQLDNLDYLFAVMEAAQTLVPSLKLWLFGKPSAAVVQYAKEHPGVRLFGYVPHHQLVNYIQNLDIAAYPRQIDLGGRFILKLADYMACGVPIVSTNMAESFIVCEAGAGLIASSEHEFVECLVRLARSSTLRRELGEAGRHFGTQHDWGTLAQRYEREVFDVYTIPDQPPQ